MKNLSKEKVLDTLSKEIIKTKREKEWRKKQDNEEMKQKKKKEEEIKKELKKVLFSLKKVYQFSTIQKNLRETNKNILIFLSKFNGHAPHISNARYIRFTKSGIMIKLARHSEEKISLKNLTEIRWELPDLTEENKIWEAIEEYKYGSNNPFDNLRIRHLTEN